MKQLRKIMYFVFLIMLVFPVVGQRKMEKLDRGVLAMPKSASQMFISWRHFATDIDEIGYNIYYSTTPTGTFTKLNSTPITNSTNYTAQLSTGTSAYTFIVKSVLNGVEKEEAGSYTVAKSTPICRIVKDYDFEPLPSEYSGVNAGMKFCWPADLNGDGKYDFVLDRLPGSIESDAESDDEVQQTLSTLIEAYSSEGQFMWRIKMGVNVKTSEGHGDMVTAYDMDGDGKAEVLMCVSEGTTFADGTVVTAANGTVTDYTGKVGSAPQWLSIVNGETGVEIDRILLPRLDEIATQQSNKWKHITGHFIIAYLDGIHPSLIYQFKNRQINGNFTGVHAAWRFIDGKLILQWSNLIPTEWAQFHQVRAGDVNGDGRDNFVEGGYVLDYDGSLLNRHQGGIVHGDRHCLADIDPDRPGLEHFIVQQRNSNTLGMAINDAKTGELIKGIYASGVIDVGRGFCGAFDSSTRGLQFCSTMNSNNLYDCKGKYISGALGTYPAETLWWGANLSRRNITSAGNDKNPTIDNFRIDLSPKSFYREVTLYHENNGHGTYYFNAPNAGRAAFWGDLLGDWREELIYCRNNKTGFVIIANWEETAIRQYTLMQNPAYRIQTTARGYYQTADVDFYMAADMPNPPIPPVQKSDLYYTTSGWIDNNDANDTYTDGKSIMFDIRGGNSTYTLNSNMSPSRLWLMNPIGADYTFNGSGKFTGSMDVIKSLQGDVTFNGDYEYTGTTRVSEGRLFVNGSLVSKVQLDARGVIGGNAVLNGGIVVETGLNVEGGRIEAGMPGILGTLTIVGNLNLPGRNNLAFDIDQTQTQQSDLLQIQGDFNVVGTNHTIIINPITTITAGTLTLITYTGTSNVTTANITVKGVEGIPYSLKIEDNAIKIEFTEPRSASIVEWKGGQSNIWDFQSMNFFNGATEDIFVPGDNVTFNDNAVSKTIVINETMPVSNMTFNNSIDYTISGDGVIGGIGGLTKSNVGKLSILNEENSFTGAVIVENSTLKVASVKNGNLPSSIGASTGDAANWIMKNATLQTAGLMATNRSMTIEEKLIVNNPTTNNSILISGNISGANAELEITGNGTLTLGGVNNLGKVTVKEGLLLLASADGNRYSMGNANIVLEGGVFRMFDINTASNTGTFSNNIDVPEGVYANWYLPSRWGLSGKLTGSGTIHINVPYIRSDFNGDWREFTGKIEFTKGSSYGSIRLNSATMRNLANADIHLGAGTDVYVASNGGGEVSTTNTITFGALSGEGALSGRNNYTIGAKGINSIYRGSISNGVGKLTKRGVGSLTLAGNNAYTGGTTIEAGTLILTNTTGSATGIGNVIVSNGATLMGTGTMSGSAQMSAGSTIAPGVSENSIGTLKIGANLVLRDDVKTIIKLTTSSNDKIKVDGNVTLKGTLELVRLSGTYNVGDKFTIFDVAGAINGNFTEIIPEFPAEGLIWDMSKITDGIVSIASATLVNSIDNTFVQIYPTMIDDVCHISFGDIVGNIKIELINHLGKTVYNNTTNADASFDINMSKFSSGLYVVKISTKENVLTYNIIKK